MARPDYPRRPRERRELLARRQKLKMAESAHAYVRGSTERFYEWLVSTEHPTIPDGPSIWICGDCHIGNLGPVADGGGNVAVDIRDFDQTVVGNPAHDLVRLGLSLAMAARGSDLPGVTTARMLERMIDGYEAALLGGRRARDPEEKPAAVKFALKEALRRSWKHLLRERIEDLSPDIPLGSRFWPLTRREREAVDALFRTEGMRRLVTALKCREDDAKVRVLDAAFWMKGCSSLGGLRYAVLARVGSASVADGRLCLVDIKEAVRACSPAASRTAMPRDHGARVVAGARALTPFLGTRMRHATLLNRSVFVRELLPQDLKIEIRRISQEEAWRVARFLANRVGIAHARQMDAATRRSWRKELGRHRPKTLDAPSWLWTSVVDLVARHEAAYLDHCRRHALEELAPE